MKIIHILVDTLQIPLKLIVLLMNLNILYDLQQLLLHLLLQDQNISNKY